MNVYARLTLRVTRGHHRRLFTPLLLVPLCLPLGCASEASEAPSTLLTAEAQVAKTPDPADDQPPLCGAATLTDPKTLLDVGHTSGLSRIVRSGDRLLAQDAYRWILWDTTTKRPVVSGTFSSSWRQAQPRPARDGSRVVGADLAGDILITPGPLSFDVRAARDGAVLATIPIEDRMVTLSGIAQDGSYVYVATDVNLRMWDRTGRLLNDQPGTYYAGGYVRAEPDGLHHAGGLSETVETFTTSGEKRSTPLVAGDFHAWFLDGAHFVTRTATAFQVYRADGTFVRDVPLVDPQPGLFRQVLAGGDGQFVWVTGSTRAEVHVYRIDGGATPVTTFVGRARNGHRTHQTVFGIGQRRLRFLNLRGAAPSWIDRDAPAADWPVVSVDRDGTWAFGDTAGSLWLSAQADPTPPARLGCGAITALAGAGNELALSTGDGNIRVFDLASGDRRPVYTLEKLPARNLAYAAGGRYLVLQSRSPFVGSDDRSIRVIEPATGELVHEWREQGPSEGKPQQVSFAAAKQADVVARNVCTLGVSFTCAVHVSKLDGTPLFSSPQYIARNPYFGEGFALSPDGKGFALAQEKPDLKTAEVVLYEDGVPVATIPNARSVQFVDDAQLLIGTIHPTHGGTVMHLADRRGVLLKMLPNGSAPETPRGDSSEYYYKSVSAYRVNDGTEVWNAFRVLNATSFSAAMGAIMGKRVAFSGDHRVVVDLLP